MQGYHVLCHYRVQHYRQAGSLARLGIVDRLSKMAQSRARCTSRGHQWKLWLGMPRPSELCLPARLRSADSLTEMQTADTIAFTHTSGSQGARKLCDACSQLSPRHALLYSFLSGLDDGHSRIRVLDSRRRKQEILREIERCVVEPRRSREHGERFIHHVFGSRRPISGLDLEIVESFEPEL